MRLRPPPTDPAPDLDHIDILELMATGKRTTTWDALRHRAADPLHREGHPRASAR